MSNIKIDHGQVRELAKTYDNAKQTIDEILTKLDSTQSSLSSIWEGKAWDQFNTTYGEFKPKVTDFGNFLKSVGDQLRENARVMEEADNALQKANKLK